MYIVLKNFNVGDMLLVIYLWGSYGKNQEKGKEIIPEIFTNYSFLGSK